MTAATAELQQAILDALIDQTRLIRSLGPSSGSRTWFWASGTSSIPLLKVNGDRKGAVIVNTDANTLYILYGGGRQDTATTASGGWTYMIPSGSTWEMPQPAFIGPIYGVWTGIGVGVAETTEW